MCLAAQGFPNRRLKNTPGILELVPARFFSTADFINFFSNWPATFFQEVKQLADTSALSRASEDAFVHLQVFSPDA
jgi:hypothetical protein